MNESEFVRGQLATERIHAAQVANACASLFGASGATPQAHTAFREAGVQYLVWVLSRFEQRDQLLAERAGQAESASGHTRQPAASIELGALAGRAGSSREALTRLEQALAAAAPAAGAAWQDFAQYFNTTWRPRHEAIERHLAQQPRIAGWRALCALDADSILEERARYTQVAERLPPGVTLVGAADR